MVRHCTEVVDPGWSGRHPARESEVSGDAGAVATAAADAVTAAGPTVYINLDVVVSESHDPGDDRLYDQILQLNEYFGATNASLALCPGPGTKYNFKGVIGNPNIHFSVTSIKRRTMAYPVSGVDDVIKNEDINPASVNVFICEIASEKKILGEAILGGNVMVLHYRCVGGTRVNAIHPMFHLGLTAVHEMGHIFDLPHPFDQPCFRFFDDVPPQKYPNTRAALVAGPDGKNDNMSFDCKPPAGGFADMDPPYSCERTDPCGATHEMFMNVMDYGDDSDLIMFSKAQALLMNEYAARSGLAQAGPDGLQIVSSDDSLLMPIWAIVAVVWASLMVGVAAWLVYLATAA